MFTGARLEAGRLWSWLVERHADARQHGGVWPSKAALQKEIKRRFPGLHSQSAQQIAGDFCEAIASAETLRKQGKPYHYPHKKPRYHQVIFTNQAARLRKNTLSLPCGTAGRLHVRMPKGVTLPGRLMEVRLHYGCLEMVCAIPDAVRSGGPTIGVDLGVNTLIAATDGVKALLTRFVICATRRRARWRRPSRTRKLTLGSHSTTLPKRCIACKRRQSLLPVTVRSLLYSTISLLPVLRWMSVTRRRPVRYAAHGRSIAASIAATVDSSPHVILWGVSISAPLAWKTRCDQVVVCLTLSTGAIPQSILAPS